MDFGGPVVSDECVHDQLVCTTCGEAIDSVVPRVVYDDLDRSAQKARRAETGMRNQLAQHRRTEPQAAVVQDILDYWHPLMPTAQIPLDGKRAERVRWALKSLRPDPLDVVAQIKEAIDGCARLPYVWGKGRMPFGTSKQRQADLVLILRDEVTIARFRGYARRPVAEDVMVSVPQSSIDAMAERVARLEWALEMLRELDASREAAFGAVCGRLDVFEQSGQSALKVAA